MRNLLLAALLTGMVAAAAHAEVYDDKSLPIYFRTPDGFTIRPSTKAGYDLGLDIAPPADYPGLVAGESRLCGVYFKAARSGEGQQWLNGRWKDQAVLASVRESVGRIMEVKSEKTFALGDVTGMEFVGPVRQDPTAVLAMSMLNTPRGGLQLTCIVRATQADTVLPVIRSIRDTIRPPK